MVFHGLIPKSPEKNMKMECLVIVTGQANNKKTFGDSFCHPSKQCFWEW